MGTAHTTPARHTVVLDWDDTLTRSNWPKPNTEWMPGATKNIRRLHEAGLYLIVFSARLSPWDPYTFQRRPDAHIAAEAQHIRHMLDMSGLTYVQVWLKGGKPGGSVYVDDKGERYGGRPGSWDKVTDKILLRLGREEPEFPAFRQEVSLVHR